MGSNKKLVVAITSLVCSHLMQFWLKKNNRHHTNILVNKNMKYINTKRSSVTVLLIVKLQLAVHAANVAYETDGWQGDICLIVSP